MKSLSVKLGVILIGVAFLGCADAWARDWRLYLKTDSYECFYDAATMINLPEDGVEVWAKSEFTKRGVAEMEKKFGKYYENLSYSMELWQINCARKKQRLLSYTAYSAEEKVLYTDEAGSNLPPWKNISRGSVEESLYKTLCK